MIVSNKTRRLVDSVTAALRDFSGLQAVYYRQAKARQAPPFVVFLLDLVRMDGEICVYDLTAECVDYSDDPADCDGLAASVAEEMDCFSHTDDFQSWQCWVESIRPVDDADRSIQRRRITMTMRYVERMKP